MVFKTTPIERENIVNEYENGASSTSLAKKYNISCPAVCGLLNRRGIKRRDQSLAQRKYYINQDYFDEIDSQKKAYFIGILYADGYNDTSRNAISLSLKEDDVAILKSFTHLLQPNKPLQYIKYNHIHKTWSNQYRMVIANKHISNKLLELGIPRAKSFIVTFPCWLRYDMIPHFIRGFFDGNGWVSKNTKKPAISIVSTESFCVSLAIILKNKLNIDSYVRPRHRERHNSIRMLELTGRHVVGKFIEYIYKDAEIYMIRKQERAYNINNYI